MLNAVCLFVLLTAYIFHLGKKELIMERQLGTISLPESNIRQQNKNKSSGSSGVSRNAYSSLTRDCAVCQFNGL